MKNFLPTKMKRDVPQKDLHNYIYVYRELHIDIKKQIASLCLM